MSNRFNTIQSGFIDQDNRQMKAQGFAMSTELNDIWAAIDTGPTGIVTSAADIDAVVAGGKNFTRDKDTGDGTSLVFAWYASQIYCEGVLLAVSAGSLTLVTATTNYIELDNTGTVSRNTGGFTSGRFPLWIVTTSSGSYSDNNVVNAKSPYTFWALGPVNGTLLSAAAATKEIAVNFGTISGTSNLLILSPGFAATLTAAVIAESNGMSASDTDYWTFGLVNVAAGSGSTQMLDATAVNTTKATGGSALVTNTRRLLTLTSTSVNLNTAANDLLYLLAQKTGSPANLAGLTLRLDFLFTG